MRSKALFFLRPPTVFVPSFPQIPSFSVGMACQRDHTVRTNLKLSTSTLYSTRNDVYPFLTTKKSNGNYPIWIDTDVGFDDVVAIGCCCGVSSGGKHEGSKIDTCNVNGNESMLAGISTVGGGLTPDQSEGVEILRGLIPGAFEGPNALPIVAGQTNASNGKDQENSSGQKIEDPFWLAKCREQMTEFCDAEGLYLTSGKDKGSKGNTTCSKAIFDDETKTNRSEKTTDDNNNVIKHVASNGKFDLVCLGPLTNLAHWLEEIPNFGSNHLKSIWILGGNIPIRMSSSQSEHSSNCSIAEEVVEAEFNFSRDPEAVRSVFRHAGLKNTRIYVVPQEVCDRKAFEQSFGSEEKSNAATIIENWLQSSQQLSSKSEDGMGSQSPRYAPVACDGRDGDAKTGSTATTSVESLLPALVVRLIRKRTFSVYGDPICIYARHYTSTSSSDCDTKPRILWKNYCTSGTNNSITGDHEYLAADSKGRLIVSAGNETSLGRKELLTPTGGANQGNDKNQGGVTVRIAHHVELGPIYMDWLATSLISSSSKTK